MNYERIYSRKSYHLNHIMERQEKLLTKKEFMECQELKRKYNEIALKNGLNSSKIDIPSETSPHVFDCFFYALKAIGENPTKEENKVILT